ncbi:MAG TPA: hypothetical protein VFQ35_15595 [Polyangiaceae bacterium]|nr:hypothetical protein [Polyangiaceae bacterium]
MQRSRSFVRFVWPAFAALVVLNCTVKVEDGDGHGGSSSASGGAANGGGGTANLSGGVANSSGGTAGASTGGAPVTSGGMASGGEAGAAQAQGGSGAMGGAGVGGDGGSGGGPAADACEDCLLANCTAELEACLADSRCYSDDPDQPGQYQDMVQCIDQTRVMHSVKRVDVVDCGLAIVNSSNLAWPPDEMASTTTDLINCMATGQTNKPNNNGWSNGDPDVPTDPISQKWADGSCAKTSCTSQL